MRTTGGRERGQMAAEPELAWDAGEPRVRPEPIDAVDAFFQAASAALVAGEEDVEIPPESHALAAALRRAYRDGAAARQELERAVGAHRTVVPALIVRDGDDAHEPYEP